VDVAPGRGEVAPGVLARGSGGRGRPPPLRVRAKAFLRALGGGNRGDVPQRARVRDLFLRVLGLIYVVAFVSLTIQLPVLLESHGLLPARDLLESVRGESFWRVPTLFWLDASDTTLELAGWAGAAAGGLLALGIAPRAALLVAWAIYLSFVTVGQSFFAFQWDNLLLESAVAALAVAPAGLTLRGAPSPGPLGIFLVLWLAFRLHFESGIAKLAGGDPSWRDLTAMASYYETAPIPTWLAWYAHQAPLWFHELTSLVTLVGEVGVPLLFFVPSRRARAAAFVLVLALQATIELTANYAFFNVLSVALALLLLDDEHLAWVARRFGRELAPRPPVRPRRWRTAALAVYVAALVALSVVPFLRVLRIGAFRDVDRAISPFRSVDAYYLFTSMTLVRKEAVIEGSQDGETWESYELRWKPGDVDRAPGFVAPHQPRVDFLCWFLLLGGHDDEYFQTLVKRIATEPGTVAPLFARMPFGGAAPRWLRVHAWRYRFTDAATRASTGAWWSREDLGTSNEIDASLFARPPR
jgi:hypothetical protein